MNITDMKYFTNAAGLRNWLNTFTDKELQQMGFDNADYLVVHVMESKLTDGSAVSDLSIKMR